MTASSAASAVQAAVFARLSLDATLAAMTDRIGDRSPDAAAKGRLVVITVTSEVRDRRLSNIGGNAAQLLLSIATHVEDSQGATGAKTAQQINARVIELLDNAELPVAGWTFVSCDFSDAVQLQDGAWRTITSDFDLLVEDP